MGPTIEVITYEDFVARSKYLRQGLVLTSHSLLWYVITYPWLIDIPDFGDKVLVYSINVNTMFIFNACRQAYIHIWTYKFKTDNINYIVATILWYFVAFEQNYISCRILHGVSGHIGDNYFILSYCVYVCTLIINICFHLKQIIKMVREIWMHVNVIYIYIEREREREIERERERIQGYEIQYICR